MQFDGLKRWVMGMGMLVNTFFKLAVDELKAKVPNSKTISCSLALQLISIEGTSVRAESLAPRADFQSSFQPN
jgi:hypothetical protein